MAQHDYRYSQIHIIMSCLHPGKRTTNPPSRQWLPIPQWPWSHIAIDFIIGLPESDDNMVPTPCPYAWTVHILRNIQSSLYLFRYFGIPENIVSDRGTQFTSRVWASFMERLGVSVSLTSSYHPQVNRQVERMNQETGCFLRTVFSVNQYDSAQFLQWAEYARILCTTRRCNWCPSSVYLVISHPTLTSQTHLQ